MTKRCRRRWFAGCATAAVLSLSACGGGDGPAPGTPSTGGTPAPTATGTPTAPPPSAETLEYERSNAAVAAHADAAYRAGATGRGIKIAVIDTCIRPDLAEFAGRIDPASADMGGNRGLVDVYGHGTAVTSIILAARNGSGIHGMAFEAVLISFNATLPEACSAEQCSVDSGLVTRAIDAAIAAKARIINFSLNADEADRDLLEAVRRAADAGILMVISAGNKSGSEPRFLSQKMAEAGGDYVIIAGGHDAAGRPYAHGNKAGSGAAAARYITSLGVDVNMTGRDGPVVTFSGTSPAAAAVSGAAALIAQARPDLTGAQIATLILQNATDAGSPGRDPVYGNGILNLAPIFAAR